MEPEAVRRFRALLPALSGMPTVVCRRCAVAAELMLVEDDEEEETAGEEVRLSCEKL